MGTTTLPKSHLHAGEAFRVPREDLIGWCIQYRVWAYGYGGQDMPEPVQREHLDMAVQHHRIYSRYWDQTGGAGRRHGEPGSTPAHLYRNDDECPYCNGTGRVYDSVHDLDDTVRSCDNCHGHGEIGY